MLTKSDITQLALIATSPNPTSLYYSSHYSCDNLFELIAMMSKKIWSDCGESLADFLIAPASLDINDLNQVPENLILQSDLSLQESTIEQEKEVLDFRKVLL